MAEIRKFDPSLGEGIQRQVRDLLGENLQPSQGTEALPADNADSAPEDHVALGEDEVVLIDFDWSATMP